MPRLPFKSSDSDVRETPKPSAAFVTDNPSGSIQNSRMTSPGWGGLCMTIFYSSELMIRSSICNNSWKSQLLLKQRALAQSALPEQIQTMNPAANSGFSTKLE
jgi:hypothetical protein